MVFLRSIIVGLKLEGVLVYLTFALRRSFTGALLDFALMTECQVKKGTLFPFRHCTPMHLGPPI